MAHIPTQDRPESKAVPSDIHVPDGPPVGAPHEPALALQRDTQVAVSETAAGMHSVDSILNASAQLPYSEVIEREMVVRLAELIDAQDAAEMIGNATVFDIKTGRLAREPRQDETPNEARLRRTTLPAVDVERRRSRKRLAKVKDELREYKSYLAGKTTDGTGRNLAAPIPSGTYKQWRRRKFLTKAIWVPFDLGILYFTLSLVTRTEPGPLQLLQQAIEAICLVGLSALIMVFAASQLADAIARVRRHSSAPEEGTKLRWAIVILFGALLASLAFLLAWVRAAYLFGGVTSGSEVPLSFGFFLAISIIWLLAPGILLCALTLFGHLNNEYVGKALQLREEHRILIARINDAKVESELRNDSIFLQEERVNLIHDQYEIARTVTIPQTTAQRKAGYLAELALNSGDPTFTEAIIAHREAIGIDNKHKFDDPLAGIKDERRTRRASRRRMGSASNLHESEQWMNAPSTERVNASLDESELV